MKRATVVIPLDGSLAGRVLLWTLAGLVYLSVIALAVAGAADGMLGAASENANVAIVSLPAPLDAGKAEGDRSGVTAVLLADPDIVRVDRVAPKEVMELVGMDDSSVLPLPSLLEVRFRPATEPDFARVSGLVQAIVPDAAIADAGKAGGARVDVAIGLRVAGLLAAALLLLAALALVAAITQLIVRHHHQTVDLVRTMGAHDRFVARQLGRHVLGKAFTGGAIGFVAAALTILLAMEAGQLMELPGLAVLTSHPAAWVLLAVVPVLLALIVAVTARVTASLTLRRMP
jgi:cell division transport system permease protein